jgi:ClpP class serine protease
LTTAEGQKEILDVLYDMADVFLNAVATGRNKDIEEVKENFGKGAEVSAQEALKKGMIDEIINTADLYESVTKKPTPINARLAQTNEERKAEMSETNDMPDLDLLKKENTAKVKEKIKSVEAILNDFDGDDPKVVEAVKKVIDDEKYKDDVSVDNVKSLAAKAAYETQKELLAAARKSRTELAEKLEDVPDDKDKEVKKEGDKSKVDKGRIDRMCKGWRKVRPNV